MAGRRTRTRKQINTKSTAETIKDNGNASSNDEINHQQQTQLSELPRDILELAISKLSLRDNIRASAVCKWWKTLAASVRKADKPPLLMFFKSVKNMYELYDPLQRRSHWLELPELQGSRFCYAKEGWLLLYKPSSRTMFFYYPYTRETIDLPVKELGDETVAFSSAPTSASCVVFTIKAIRNESVIVISTCHPGASQWTTGYYPNYLTFLRSLCISVVSCNGIFYCLNDLCALGIHSPGENGTWSFNSIWRPTCPWPWISIHDETILIDKFMVERNGDIFLVYTCSSEDHPVIYKLDLANRAWVEMKTLGGTSLFASHGSSVARTDLLGSMRNNVYFAKVRYHGRRCFSYSLDDRRYYPANKRYDWGREAEGKCWIDAPPQYLSILR